MGGIATNFQVSWAGAGLLATCSKERVARLGNDNNIISSINFKYPKTELKACLLFKESFYMSLEI